MSKKFVENEIVKIKELALAGRTDIQHHVEFNTHVLQALIGGELTKNKKGEMNIKFTHMIPTMSQVAEIAKICDNYAQIVAETLSNADEEDEMAIPVENITREIPTINRKINNKTLQAYAIDTNGVLTCMLSGTDCITIATYGKSARKNAVIKRTIIIGGCVLVIAGGITAGVIISNKKKDGEFVEADIDTVPEVEIDETYDPTNIDESFAMAFIA
jgi:hypothetical protein